MYQDKEAVMDFVKSAIVGALIGLAVAEFRYGAIAKVIVKTVNKNAQ